MTVLPTRMVGARKLPVGPSMASMAAFEFFSADLNSLTFLPFETISFEAVFAMSEASFLPSFLFAETISFGSIPLASRNLDARVQDVQPLRW